MLIFLMNMCKKKEYVCQQCNYKCNKKELYYTHLLTKRHTLLTNQKLK